MSEDRKWSANPSEAALERAFEWLTRLNSGHARAADWTAYQAWRRTSRDNEAAAREAESLWEVIPDAYADAAEAPSTRGRRRPWAWRATAAGALAAAAAIALLLWMPALERLQADYATDVAELQQVTLPDASHLILDGATAVKADFGE